MNKFETNMNPNWENVLNDEEIAVFKRAIKDNVKGPMSQMGDGVEEVAFRLEDVTETTIDDAKKYTGIKYIEKVIKYLSIHEEDFHDHWYIVAEDRYVFFDKDGQYLANTYTPAVIDTPTQIYRNKDYKLEFNKIEDKNVEAFIVEYKRLKKINNR